MNVAELKKVLADAPDDTPVGVSDYFGAMVSLNGAYYHKPGMHWHQEHGWIELDVPDIGREPD